MTAVAASDPVTTDVRDPDVRPGGPRWLWPALIAAVALVAFVVRYGLLVRGGGLDGSDVYDDGVYYAAADALVHGRIPYRDFLFLQPPGTVLVLTPFAWIGSITRDGYGVAAARLFFIGVGALNAGLVTLLARRFGMVAAIVAGLGYAVFFPAAYSERSTLLEPLGSLGILLALALAERSARWPRAGMLLAGVAAGVAVGMKIWYVVPLLVIGAFHWRQWLRYLLGAAIGGAAVYLPFLLADPAATVREIVLDQIGRPRIAAETPLKRVVSFLGAPNLHLSHPWSAVLSPNKIGLVLAIVTLVCVIAALTVRGARIYPVLLASSVAVLLASPSYFVHYGALTAPFLALTIGIGVTRLLRPIPVPWARAALGALVVLVILAVNVPSDLKTTSQWIPTTVLRPAAQQVRGCVLSDDPQTLAALDVLSRDLAQGCPLWPDVTGWTYDRDSYRVHGQEVPRISNPLWERDVTAYLLSGAAVIVHRQATELDPKHNRIVRSGPILAKSGNWTLHAVQR